MSLSRQLALKHQVSYSKLSLMITNPDGLPAMRRRKFNIDTTTLPFDVYSCKESKKVKPHGLWHCKATDTEASALHSADMPIPAFIGTHWCYMEGWPGWVDLHGWLHTEIVYPSADGYPTNAFRGVYRGGQTSTRPLNSAKALVCQLFVALK